MEEKQESNIKDTPVWTFVQDGWVDWVQSIGDTNIDEEDFVLMLMWVLDSIKEQDQKIDDRFWKITYNGFRNYQKQNEDSTKDDVLTTLTNLVCACALSCLGMAISGSQDNLRIYSELVNVFGDHWSKIKSIKWNIMQVSPPKELKEWVASYMGNDVFYTLKEEVEWSDENLRRLPAAVRNAKGDVTVNVRTLINQLGVNYNDFSKIEEHNETTNIMNNKYINSTIANTGAGTVNTGDISNNSNVLCISDSDQQKIKELVSELVKVTKDSDNEDIKKAVETISEECKKPSWSKKTLKIAFNALLGIATSAAANYLIPVIDKVLALLA